MPRYTISLDGDRLEDFGDYYAIKCKNFRDPVGPPLGGNRPQNIKVGFTKRMVKRVMGERNTFMLGALFGIIPVEMPRITSAHLGVKRPLRYEQDGNADGNVYVVVMHPTNDVYASIEGESISLIELDPPSREVFVALLSKNAKPEQYPEVDFWLEHCNWVDSDPDAPQFPVNYMQRYEKACIWTG
ncbi:MAG: hypothetical protein AAGK92_00190 [Pseudomonadota bacterium]